MQNLLKSRRLILIIVLAVVGIAVIGAGVHSNQKTASVSIVVGAPDIFNTSATIDKDALALHKHATSVAVKPGKHTLTITKSGYNKFSKEFTVTNDQPVTIQAVLERTGNPPAFTSLSSVEPTKSTAGWTLVSTQYYGSNDWALAFAQSQGSNTAFFVVRYDDPTAKWLVVDGPQSELPDSSLQQYPSDLQLYLRQHNYVIEVL
jgi:hypothetical protein